MRQRRRRRRAIYSWWFPWLALALITMGVSLLPGAPFDATNLLPWDDEAAPTDRRSLKGNASVIDGDTLEIHGQRIRLHGIDAPESRQLCDDAAGKAYRCGQKAALALADKIGRRTVSCEPRDTDRYGRVVAVCWIGLTDLNGWLVEEGWAVAYRRYSLDYVSNENAAREAKRGIWAGPFIVPADWRNKNR